MRDFAKDWEIETQGQIYVADLEELKQWIAEGAVLPSDKVKRGDLRWLPAEKVPELYDFFNLDNFNTAANDFKLESPDFQTQFVFEALAEENISEWIIEKVCHLHRDFEAVFVCDICQKSFCKACPKSYGTVKICPLCGALCRGVNEPAKEIHKSVGAINKPYLITDKNTDKHGGQNQSRFQKPNFTKAFVYLFKCVKSLVWAVKVSIFSHLNKLRS
jgi:hypothetical protein